MSIVWRSRAPLALVAAISGCARASEEVGPLDAGALVEDGASGADARTDEPAGCEAPDLLVVLDRTLTMHKRPDGTAPANTAEDRATTKWAIAIDAIETLADGFGDSIRFGLALFPRDPGGGACHTLSEVIEGAGAQNLACETGEVLVSPDQVASASTVVDLLDPETTLMCRSTPIAGGLLAARDELSRLREVDRPQLVFFISDGKDTCDEAAAIAAAQVLAGDGVRVFAIGFDGAGGVDPGFLNDLACAGRTATGFPETCVADASSGYLALDRLGPPLYLEADDARSLNAALASTAQGVCCGCVD